MPKIKTHRATAKRVKRRGGTGLKRRNAFGTHYLAKRSTKRKRALRKNEPVSAADSVNVRRALGMK
ncbi:50S ribosomal protein L35 [Candidatus Latescibacterota bacterium]